LLVYGRPHSSATPFLQHILQSRLHIPGLGVPLSLFRFRSPPLDSLAGSRARFASPPFGGGGWQSRARSFVAASLARSHARSSSYAGSPLDGDGGRKRKRDEDGRERALFPSPTTGRRPSASFPCRGNRAAEPSLPSSISPSTERSLSSVCQLVLWRRDGTVSRGVGARCSFRLVVRDTTRRRIFDAGSPRARCERIPRQQ